jgi:hypothetical protein
MEYIVDFPIIREFEFISDVGYLGGYLEGSVPPWCKFQFRMEGVDVFLPTRLDLLVRMVYILFL